MPHPLGAQEYRKECIYIAKKILNIKIPIGGKRDKKQNKKNPKRIQDN